MISLWRILWKFMIFLRSKKTDMIFWWCPLWFSMVIFEIVLEFLMVFWNSRIEKISFGGIPNSSLTPYAIFDYMGAFLRNAFAHVDNIIPVIKNNHMAAPVKVARQQTTPELCLRNLHQHVPELFGTFRTLPPEPTPTRAGTLQNPPEASETFRNQPFGTFRNLPPEPTPAYAGTLRNLHCFTSELSGTFRNPLPEPTPAPTHAGTLRNLPEPSSATCSCDPHRHTPELIWAEDPISLRCWGKNTN